MKVFLKVAEISLETIINQTIGGSRSEVRHGIGLSGTSFHLICRWALNDSWFRSYVELHRRVASKSLGAVCQRTERDSPIVILDIDIDLLRAFRKWGGTLKSVQ